MHRNSPQRMRPHSVLLQQAERRVLILENPGLRGSASVTPSLYAGLQLILPGEMALCHRHSQCALRFVLEGEGAYTSVDGEKAVMRPFDLVLTPGGQWHEQLDPGSSKIYVNVPDAGHVAVVDRNTRQQVTFWVTGELHANFPLALDAEHARVISVFRRPPHLQAYAMATGRKLAGVDVCSDSDDVIVDPRRQRVYVICGEGFVDVLDSSANAYAPAAGAAGKSYSRDAHVGE